jgi:hypothetical protein
MSGHSNQPGGTGLICGGRAMLLPLLLTAAAPLILPRAALTQLPAVTCSCLNPALLHGFVSTHAVDVHSCTVCCLVQGQCSRESCCGGAVYRLQTKSDTALVLIVDKVSLCSQSSVGVVGKHGPTATGCSRGALNFVKHCECLRRLKSQMFFV